MNVKPIPIAEGIAALREQLQRAINSAPGEGLKFEVQSINLEMQVIATTTGGGEVAGGVEWKLLGYQIGGKVSAGHTYSGAHKVTLSLKPQMRDAQGATTTVEVGADSSEEY